MEDEMATYSTPEAALADLGGDLEPQEFAGEEPAVEETLD